MNAITLKLLSIAKTKYYLLLITSLLAISSCTSSLVPLLKQPDIKLVNVELIDASLFQQTFLLYIQISNPNSSSFSVDSLKYSVLINRLNFAKGKIRKDFTIKGKKTYVLKVPAHTNLWGQAPNIIHALKNPHDTVNYTIKGKIKLKGWFEPTLRIMRDGEFTPEELLHKK